MDEWTLGEFNVKYVPSHNFLYHEVCRATDFKLEEKGLRIAINL